MRKSKTVLSLGSESQAPLLSLQCSTFPRSTEKGAEDRIIRHTFSNGVDTAHEVLKTDSQGRKRNQVLQ